MRIMDLIAKTKGALTATSLLVGVLIYLGVSCQAIYAQKRINVPSLPDVKFVLLKDGCINNQTTCMAITYLEPQSFNDSTLRLIGQALRKQYKKKKGATVFIFDSVELGMTHIKGNRHLTDLSREARGGYFLTAKEEYLKYSESEAMPFQWSRIIDFRQK